MNGLFTRSSTMSYQSVWMKYSVCRNQSTEWHNNSKYQHGSDTAVNVISKTQHTTNCITGQLSLLSSVGWQKGQQHKLLFGK